MKTSLLILLLPLICATSPVLAESGKGETYADQQKSQSWATDMLAKSPRHREWVKISNGGRSYKAWVIHPQGPKAAGVVLVLHEVFGLTDSTINTADEIASMGYIAIVPDVLTGFGPNGGDTNSFANSRLASDQLTSLSDSAVNATINTWADYGMKLPGAKKDFAILGLSWGGGAAFRYAASVQRSDLKAVAVFYDVGPPAETQHFKNAPSTLSVAAIQAPVYGFYPSKDERDMDSLQATKDAMTAAHKTFETMIYIEADHAYMRLGEDPINHNPANTSATRSSLSRMETILQTSLK